MNFTMGSHLQLYASKRISLEEAKDWCHVKCVEIIEDYVRPQAVEDEMRRLDYDEVDHLEHWAAGGAVTCFSFLVCEAHLCDQALVERAMKASDDYLEMLRAYPDSRYAKVNWRDDEAVLFLKSHLGYVVWGYNDGC
jgi:hypothetical protein